MNEQGFGTVVAYSTYYPGGTEEKDRKPHVGTVGVPAKIRIGYLPVKSTARTAAPTCSV
jgi:hypothetical protein